MSGNRCVLFNLSMSNIHMTHAYIFLTQSYIFRVTKCSVWSITYIGLYFEDKGWCVWVTSGRQVDLRLHFLLPRNTLLMEPLYSSTGTLRLIFLTSFIFLFHFVLFPSIYILCYLLFSSNHLFTEMVITKKERKIKEKKKERNLKMTEDPAQWSSALPT